MAVENEIMVIFIGVLFTYLVLYKKNRLLGYMGFMGLGFATMAYSTGNTFGAVGLLMILGSIIGAIADLLTPKKK